MSVTPFLSLPLLAPSQAQKHVTHNEALMRLDDLAQLSVLSMALATPPANPAADARYIAGPAATGGWSGHSGDVAVWRDGSWTFYEPQRGWVAYVEDIGLLHVFNGSGWQSAGAFPYLGINAIASATQRLAVKSPSVLFDHDGADSRLTVSRQSPTDTASVVFQTNYQGGAEFGLTGGQQFQLKVSANGSSWANALSVDPVTALATVAGAPVATLGIASKGYVDSATSNHAFDYQTGANQAHAGSASWIKVLNFSTARVASANFSSASNQYTAPQAGIYVFTGQVNATMGATGATVLAALGKNGLPAANVASRVLAAGATDVLPLTAIMALATGDTVDLRLYSTAACTINAALTGIGGARV